LSSNLRRKREATTALRIVLGEAAPRPASSGTQHAKNQYAVRFADSMARLLAKDLRGLMRGIAATTKRSASSVRGRKQLDVNFSTPATGLALGISLKSVHIREATGAKRYTHNLKRNEEELRIEASGYHKRQPYAVMVGVLFLPFDSCTDGKKDNPSSFGSWVRHLRPYAGRRTPKDDEDRFEKIYIGLYEPNGFDWRFFDIETNPPKNGRPSQDGELKGTNNNPRRLLSYQEFLDAIYHAYLQRNAADFVWADGTKDPIPEKDIPE